MEVFDELVIEFVQSKSIIYDKSSSNYKNVSLKKEAWKEISDIPEIMERLVTSIYNI